MESKTKFPSSLNCDDGKPSVKRTRGDNQNHGWQSDISVWKLVFTQSTCRRTYLDLFTCMQGVLTQRAPHGHPCSNCQALSWPKYCQPVDMPLILPSHSVTLTACFNIWSRSGSSDRHIGGLVKDCSNSSALAMELLQSCIKWSTW